MPDVPKVFYKYIGPTGAKAFLVTPQLRFTDFRKLDDLMEVLPGQRPLTEEEIHKFALEKSASLGVSYEKCREFAADLAHEPEWERNLRKLFGKQPCNLFICCLTERWDSGAMWALYAERHTGMVFGLSHSALPSRATALAPVEYSDIRPQMPMIDVDRAVLAQAAITKSRDWEYQKEWRAASGTGDVELLSPSSVAEIIVGYEARPKLIQLAKSFKERHPSSKIFHAYPNPQRHEMSRYEI